MLNRVVFSSLSPHWATPKGLYIQLDEEFGFNFDPCPLRSEKDGLSISWKGKRVFCNPPYGRGLDQWLRKAKYTRICVFLLPARTDTKWFHDLVLGKAEIRFIKGRLKFGNATENAPFPSMLVIYRGIFPRY